MMSMIYEDIFSFNSSVLFPLQNSLCSSSCGFFQGSVHPNWKKKKFSYLPLVVCMHAYCFYFTVYVQVFSFQTARFLLPHQK